MAILQLTALKLILLSHTSKRTVNISSVTIVVQMTLSGNVNAINVYIYRVSDIN